MLFGLVLHSFNQLDKGGGVVLNAGELEQFTSQAEGKTTTIWTEGRIHCWHWYQIHGFSSIYNGFASMDWRTWDNKFVTVCVIVFITKGYTVKARKDIWEILHHWPLENDKVLGYKIITDRFVEVFINGRAWTYKIALRNHFTEQALLIMSSSVNNLFITINVNYALFTTFGEWGRQIEFNLHLTE